MALYVNNANTVRFDGMTEAESGSLLEFLFRHQVRAELTCRFTA
jgi:taurine dioxygenase